MISETNSTWLSIYGSGSMGTPTGVVIAGNPREARTESNGSWSNNTSACISANDSPLRYTIANEPTVAEATADMVNTSRPSQKSEALRFVEVREAININKLFVNFPKLLCVF
jgi:hypothetical protein